LLGDLLRIPARAYRGDALPALSRPNYRRELIAAGTLPVAVACVDMGVIGIVASKAFDAGALAVSLLEAAPHAAALSSIVWTSVMHGRDRVRFVMAMQLGIIACVALAAFMPVTAAGLAGLVALVIAARCCFAGFLAGRSELWRSNYPRDARASASGVFTIITTIVILTTTLALGAALDLAEKRGVEASVYRGFYLVAAATACVAVWSFSRVRWRGRAAALRAERETSRRKRPGLRSMWGVLRDDRRYRSFMSAQMVMGMANLAAQAPVVLAVADRFNLSYSLSLAITAVVPKGMMMLGIPLWSRMLARLHIVDFRAYHAWTFVLGNALVGVGVLTLSVPLMLIARGVVGAGMGGGSLAWNLGHHDFAPRDQAGTYMGVHIVLTGIRGAIAPLAGAALYTAGLGGWTFILCAAVGAVGAVMFIRMRRTLDRAPRDAE